MNPYDSIRTNLEEPPPPKKKKKKKYQERILLFLKHAYMFRRFKIIVKIYTYMYVFATFMHPGEIKFDTNKLFKKYVSHRSEHVGYKKITGAWEFSTKGHIHVK